MTAPHPRPRIVETAFWTWLAAAGLLVFSGLLIAITPTAPVFYRGAGALFAAAGFAIGYLAGRTRQGDKRFRRATVVLTIALTVLLVLFVMLTLRAVGYIWPIIIVLLISAGTLATRPSATAWFDAVEKPGDGSD